MKNKCRSIWILDIDLGWRAFTVVYGQKLYVGWARTDRFVIGVLLSIRTFV